MKFYYQIRNPLTMVEIFTRLSSFSNGREINPLLLIQTPLTVLPDKSIYSPGELGYIQYETRAEVMESFIVPCL